MLPKLPPFYRLYWRLRPVPAPPYQETPRGYSRYVLGGKLRRSMRLVWAPRSAFKRTPQ